MQSVYCISDIRIHRPDYWRSGKDLEIRNSISIRSFGRFWRMEESRQFRSPGIEICPICSVSHFPFCHLRPPSFVSNGIGGNTMIHSHPMEPIHPRPFQDRIFPTHHAPPMPRPPFPFPFHPSQKHCLVPDEVVGREGFHKRVKVDDGPVGNWGGVPMDRYNGSVSTGMSHEENERRLSLIRQHGQQRDQKNGFVGYGYPSSTNQENFVQNPALDASNMLHIRNIVSQEKRSFSESEQAHASAQTTVTPDYDRVGGEPSIGQIVSHQHLESDRHKENFVQQSTYNSWQSGSQGHIHEKYHGLNNRHQYLPPGMPISHSDSNRIPSPYSVASDMESYRLGNPRYPYSVGNAGENMHHFLSQGYPIAENSWNPRLYNESRYFPVPGSNNLAVSVSGQVGTMANCPPLPSYQIPSPPSKPYPVHLQQDIISTMAHQKPAQQILDEGNSFSLKSSLPENPRIMDASLIFKKPYRMTRPDHITVILRGLPGSGKSYLAKLLRDLEVENGGSAPRIHSMDDYFMTEVEKVEDADGPKSSSLVRGKKQITKTVMEYCYEPEMEEAYRSSMLKAFKKTVEDGIFTFVIVDDRNLRVADFAQFWAIGKNSGYEVYLLEATYKDPIGCAARNVHSFTTDVIQKMAEKWEEAPSLYLQLDIQRLYHGDDFSEHSIQEVDMDTDDPVFDEKDASPVQDSTTELAADRSSEDLLKGEFEVAEEEPAAAKELGSSKWLKNCDDEIHSKSKTEANGRNSALSGLIKSYSWSKISVHWGDQVEKRGFSIGASKHPSTSSLLIGPGAGYNLNTNPLSEEVDHRNHALKSATKMDSTFLDHLRAERESFKAVFDKRRQRIGGLYNAADDDGW